MDKLKKNYKLIAVILFGSRARGDFKPWSDYDLLVIADFSEKYLDRVGKLLEILDSGLVEPHPYTLEEAVEMLKKGNPTIIDALSEGVILYENEEFKAIKAIYEEMVRKGLKRSKVSIVLPDE
ncbi:MAG: nucleotidyltransferase domain-containing protein [Candidatus Jordarchaeales archaeon]